MRRDMKRLAGVGPMAATALGLALGMTVPTPTLGQDPSLLLSAPTRQVWPRWERTPAAARPAVVPQVAPPSHDGPVLLLSFLGASSGVVGGIYLGGVLCRTGCGNGEYAGLNEILLVGVVGGGVGSVLGGCAAARERGCLRRALPTALLGSLAGLGGGLAAGAMSQDIFVAWITYSAIQGVITAGAIR